MNINEKLLKVFDRNGFRVGDIVENTYKPHGFVGNKLVIILVNEVYYLAKSPDNIPIESSAGSWFVVERATLIQPAVTLSDVLVKMSKNKNRLYIITDLGYIYRKGIDDGIDKTKEICHWQLGKNLFSQTQETKESIAEVLE